MLLKVHSLHSTPYLHTLTLHYVQRVPVQCIMQQSMYSPTHPTAWMWGCYQGFSRGLITSFKPQGVEDFSHFAAIISEVLPGGNYSQVKTPGFEYKHACGGGELCMFHRLKIQNPYHGAPRWGGWGFTLTPALSPVFSPQCECE